MATAETFILEDWVQGFEQGDVDDVLKDYVCAVCYNELEVYYLPDSSLCIIFCPEHGNVEKCGRVTRNTRSIQIEKGYLQFREVVRNLSDLWGSLDQPGFEYHEAERIRKHYVCNCGGVLTMQFLSKDSTLVILKCVRCGKDIEGTGGYKSKKGRR